MPLALKNSLIELAKTFERRRCNHHTLDHPLSTLSCFTSVLDPKDSSTNKNRYIIASQDEEVRRWARGVRGVPLVYVKRSVMVMEPMSEGSLSVREREEKGKLRSGIRKVGGGERGLKRGRETEDGDKEAEDYREGREAKKKKIRGPKGPNPLSVKKAKRESEGGKEEKTKTREEQGDRESGGKPRSEDADENLINGSGTKRKRRRKHGSAVGPVVDEIPQTMVEE
jgi:U3 small nucleolar RNA-associated protein 23